MRPLLHTILAGLVLLLATLPTVPGGAAQCTSEDFAKAVNGAGAALRKLSAENTPRLRAKMRALKDKKKWPDVGYEERAYRLLQDERVAAFDAGANALLARIDALGTLDPGSEPDCGKLQALQAASLELQATVKTKTAYLISKIDQMLSDAPIPTLAEAKPAKPKAEAGKKTTQATKAQAKAKVKAEAEPQPKPKPKPKPKSRAKPKAKIASTSKIEVAPLPPVPDATPRPPVSSGWSTRTTDDSPPVDIAAAQPPLVPSPGDTDAEGYSIEEIKAASAGFFGQVSANLGGVIEHLVHKSGRPTGYILGIEGGGAFLAGVRYGHGTLYMRSGGTQKIHWHGPSLGVDVGGEGSKTLFLIYKLKNPEQLYTSFTGIDGTAYLVGGVGATLVTNGSVVLAPIRSGVGLRLGASVGYLRFTPKQTWNPF